MVFDPGAVADSGKYSLNIIVFGGYYWPWSGTSDKNLRSIEVCQRKAVKALGNLKPDKKSSDFFSEFDIVEIARRFQQREAVWLYRVLKNDQSVPDYLKSIVKVKTGLRDRKRIDVTAKTATVQRSFAWRMKCVFEKVPQSVWRYVDLESFKRSLMSVI